MDVNAIGECIINETVKAVEKGICMLPESKFCKMLNNRNQEYIFVPFQDAKQVLKVENVVMSDFYELVDAALRYSIKDDKKRSRDGGNNSVNDADKKHFLQALLNGEDVLVSIEDKVMMVCQEIIKACGINYDASRKYVENSLKKSRLDYFQNLIDYIKQKVDSKQFSILIKAGLVDRNSKCIKKVCCEEHCKCNKFVDSDDTCTLVHGGICKTCKHKPEDHVKSQGNCISVVFHLEENDTVMIPWQSETRCGNKNDTFSQEDFSNNLANELSQRLNSFRDQNKSNRPIIYL